MKIKKKLFIIGILAMFFTTSCERNIDSKEILKKAITEIDSLNSYKIDAKSSYDGDIKTNNENFPLQIYCDGYLELDNKSNMFYENVFARGLTLDSKYEESRKDYKVLKDNRMTSYISINGSKWNKVVVNSDGVIEFDNGEIKQREMNVKLDILSISVIIDFLNSVNLENEDIEVQYVAEKEISQSSCYVIEMGISGETLKELSELIFVIGDRVEIDNYDTLKLKARFYISKDENKLMKLGIDIKDIMKDVIYIPDNYETEFDFNEALIELNYSDFNNVSVTLPEELNKL